MSDIFVPGLRSRFNTEQIVDDLMRLERVPRERAERNVERLEFERTFWEDLSTRARSLQESARHLFSFQNPFSDRSINSSDTSVITGTANRQALEQELGFTVKQMAASDRFLSGPLEENFRVESGTYVFTVGNEEISLDFRGGTLREFSDALNRRGRDLVHSSLIAVRPGTRSLLIESRVTGEENRLGFAGDALSLGQATGMIEIIYNTEAFEQDEIEQNEIVSFRPLNPVSTARDSIIVMEGIDIFRPGNEVDDLMPGVTINIRGLSDRPVRLSVETDREAIKDSIITFVGNYNRLMAELNILTRNDPRVLEEITYFSREEREEYRDRLGAFASDASLLQMRNNLVRAVTTQYPTSDDQNISLLNHIGIGTDARRSGASAGFDASRLRGYLEIDERVLDQAMISNLPAIRELFASSTTGDILPDTGVAFSVHALIRPFSETGGLVSMRTGNMNSRIAQENTRIETLDRQLTAREADLRRQYSIMEGAFNRMEQMSGSLDRFQQQNNRNR